MNSLFNQSAVRLYSVSPEGIATPTGDLLTHLQGLYNQQGVALRWMWLPARATNTHTGVMCCVVDPRGTSFGHDASVAIYTFYGPVHEWWRNLGLICWSVAPERPIDKPDHIRLAAGDAPSGFGTACSVMDVLT